MSLPSILTTDSRGNPSRTWPLVLSASILVMVKFALGGLTLPLIGHIPDMGGGEFAGAFGAILAGWWAREHTSKANG